MSEYKKVIEDKVKSKQAFIFMKGSPNMPMCGFSARASEVLKAAGADFGYFNILEDMNLFEELKAMNQWPTSPQIYVKGEFVGGCDIVCELFESGELKQMLA
ncbi:MAG: Grx4 family monothiol glutaredoxin [Oligoflexia bacterium]|nr:Grx4 family monothiol glutaredoxin [Oligoflexia bacterium]